MGTRALGSNKKSGAGRFSPSELISVIRQNNTNKLRAIKLGLVVADFLMIALAFGLAFQFRFLTVTSQFFAQDTPGDLSFYQSLVYFLIPVWLILFYSFKLYDNSILFAGYQEYTQIFTACTVGIMLVIVVVFVDPTLAIARGWLLLSWAFAIVLVGLERFFLRRLVFLARQNGHFMVPTYIVGANAEGIAIAEHLISAPTVGLNVIGFLDDDLPVGEEILPGVAVHGSTDNAETLVHKFGIERMIVATSGIERENLLQLFKTFVNVDDVAVWLSSGIYELMTTGVRVQDIGSMAMISVNKVRLSGMTLFAKTAIDYIGAIAGLILLSPLFLAIVIIMKRTDPGPIIHRRRVMGVGGEQFDAFKFRTMVVNADEVLKDLLENDPDAKKEFETHFKLKNDPRITRIGNFLRKTSVDELPQLINVLRREMSLVGPRMITKEEVERYGQYDMNIFTVKPGITGLWQISGRSNISYEERVRIDMFYIRNHSVWMDIQILLLTIPAVVMSRGAY
jgi:Undecaprenyl-phosphate galactose phosphotransferase WbaP